MHDFQEQQRIENFYITSRTRQTSDSSWEFLKIENERIKTGQNNSYGKKDCVKLLIYV